MLSRLARPASGCGPQSRGITPALLIHSSAPEARSGQLRGVASEWPMTRASDQAARAAGLLGVYPAPVDPATRDCRTEGAARGNLGKSRSSPEPHLDSAAGCFAWQVAPTATEH